MGREVVEALRGRRLRPPARRVRRPSPGRRSGKSTLMNLLGCLETPDGRPLLPQRCAGLRHARRPARPPAQPRNRLRVPVVRIAAAVRPLCRTLSLPLVYARVPRRDRARRATEALERVGLADRARHRPAELSGGSASASRSHARWSRNPACSLPTEPTGNLEHRHRRGHPRPCSTSFTAPAIRSSSSRTRTEVAARGRAYSARARWPDRERHSTHRIPANMNRIAGSLVIAAAAPRLWLAVPELRREPVRDRDRRA